MRVKSSHLEQREDVIGVARSTCMGLVRNFSEWQLCQNLADTSIHLPLVVFRKALGTCGVSGNRCRDVAPGWGTSWLQPVQRYPPAKEQAAIQAALGRCEDSG